MSGTEAGDDWATDNRKTIEDAVGIVIGRTTGQEVKEKTFQVLIKVVDREMLWERGKAFAVD